MKDKIIKIGLVCLGSLSVLISCFANANLVGFNSADYTFYSVPYNSSITLSYFVNPYSISCFRVASNELSCGLSFSGYDITLNKANRIICVYNDINSSVDLPLNCVNSSVNNNRVVYFYEFDSDIITYPTCPSQYTSLECQSEYSLIPVSSVDQNYCESNNLCSSQSCPDNPNVGTSNLYINDVFHPGAFNVIINIPEEIDWDYAYTSSGSNFNLDVVGYNQDTEYINSIIDQQTYKPTSEDFSRLVGMLPNYAGLLIACLFVILVFYLIKKSFK